MNCTDCNDKILNPVAEEQPYCDQCAEESSKCSSKFPADCVIYHINDDIPTRFTNLQISNKSSVSFILEKIDEYLGKISSSSGSSVSVLDSPTVDLSLLGRQVKANVKVSTTEGNQLQTKEDGLYVNRFADDGKVKVSATDIPDYLKNQIVGGSNGMVSLTVEEVEGLLKISPSLNIISLLTEIKTNHTSLFNQLFSNVTNIYNSTSQQSAKLVPYIAYPYFGPLDIFDGEGRGLSNKGYDKVYICNGKNGTPDIRGRVLVGANDSVYGGAALDNEVSPSTTGNPTITKGSKTGAFNHALTVQELPNHNHTVTDPGHAHEFRYNHGEADMNESGTYGDLMNMEGAQSRSRNTQSKTTGITLASTGGGLPHNNTQPSTGTIYIMYIP